MRHRNGVLIALVSILFLIQVCECAKKPVTAARKEDIPYIKCQVCERVAKELHSLVNKKQAEISPKKISEYQIIEVAENVCNLKKEEADWILKIDIVEQGNKLELVEQDAEGMCNSECKTIEKACQEVLGYSDTDVAEFIYKTKPQLDSLVNYLCNDLSEACSVKPPPVPKDRTPGEPFMPKPSKDAEMDKILRSMEGMPGAPGMKMYSREELMSGKNIGEEDDEDDDDNDEAEFPSKLGKVLREKESKTVDWKQKVTKGIMDTSQTLKRHANTVSAKLRKWWKGKKAAAPKKTPKGTKSEL